jgi:L-lactate dehydrogenase (cytochrome)
MIVANIDDYRKQCEARLPRFLYDYISGGPFQENTLRANSKINKLCAFSRLGPAWIEGAAYVTDLLRAHLRVPPILQCSS